MLAIRVNNYKLRHRLSYVYFSVQHWEVSEGMDLHPAVGSIAEFRDRSADLENGSYAVGIQFRADITQVWCQEHIRTSIS